MRKFLTGTALALMFAAAPAIADTASTSASGETIPSATTEQKAVSEPAMKADDNNSTMVEEGTRATTAGSNAVVGADGEAAGKVDTEAGMSTGTTLETGKDASSASGEVVIDTEDDPVSSDDS